MLSRSLIRVTAAPLSAVLLLGACYRYIPESGSELTTGAVYRGNLSPEGTQRVAPIMGANVLAFNGTVIQSTDTAFVFAISSTVKRTDPRPVYWSGEQLFVPRSAVASFDRRELDRPRTARAAILGTIGMFAAGALWLSIKGRVGGNPDGGPGPTPF